MIDRQREKFVPYANDAIDALTVISKQYTGKNLARIPVQYRKYTQSYIDSILIGLGKDLRYKSLVDKLKALSVHAISKEKVSKYGLYENVDMAQSDINKIIKYSDSLQSMFSTNDNLDDWIKAKLNHACDYVATVRDYLKFYIDERENIDQLTEEVDNLESKYNKEKIDSIIDGLQHALDIVGLEPTIGSVADGTNAVISLLRSALSKETNEQKKHLLNAAISAVSVIPFGDLAKIIKLRVLRKPAVKLLKFIKKYFKSKSPSYSDTLFEKWSDKYKRSIDCTNAKGFSQKAHCRARKLRQSGVHTQSKSIREIYKQVTNELLREFNSSMAMGTLKQINNDAKEIETMLQSTSQLEDWVKAKLNLAGEYLDDVYHHLDHFGSNDNSVDENYYDDKESLRMSRQMRFMNQSPEKKYWVTPDGNIVDAEGDHEDWIKKHDPKLRGSTLIDTYENAIKKGYIRVVYDVGTGFITLSNLNNYDFRKEGSSAHNIPSVNEKQMSSIKEFVKDKKIRMVATGKGNLLHDFGGLDESIAKEVLNYKKLKEGWKDLAIAGAIGLSGMVGNLQANPTSQSTQKSQSVTKSVSRPSLDSSFIDYIKTVENDGKVGFDKNRKLWFPHKSVEGGSDTIAYGHKIQKGEDFSNGITDDRANELLKKDLQNAVNQVYRELGNVNLTKKQLEMFTDFVFNLGTLKKFPEFTRAALNNDLNNMKLQYKRYANKKPLKGRNAAFFSRFLNEYFGFNYAIG